MASGIFKKVAFKKESTWGTAASGSGATYVRRVSVSHELTRGTIEPKEIRPDQQYADVRLGSKSVGGELKCDLSPGSFAPFIGSALRKDFASGATTGSITTVTAAAGTPGTFTRSGLSFLTDGFKIGDIVRWTGWTTTGTANNNVNYRITALTATVMSCVPLSASSAAIASKASGDTVTCTVVGKKSWIPEDSHTDDSYTFEAGYTDVNLYDVFTGCKVTSLDINVPNSDVADITVGFMGKDMTNSGASGFTSPTAAGTNGVLTGFNGSVLYNGTAIATVTGFSLKAEGNHTTQGVLGQNTTAGIYPGREKVTGTFTSLFDNATLLSDFLSETKGSFQFVIAYGNTANADFISIVIPKLQVLSYTRTDAETQITATVNFQALLNDVGGAAASTLKTSLSIQDSLA